MKKLAVMLLLILVVGCTTVRKGMPYTIKITDMNDSVKNYEECFRIAKINCDRNPKCVSFHVDQVICDNGVCIC